MKRDLKIGIFLVGALSILAVFIFIVGDLGELFKPKGYPLYLYFDSAAGLERHTLVRLAGVRIGYVKKIGLKGTRAEVTLSIDPAVQLHEGSRGTLAALGLLGEKYIEILPGDSSVLLDPGDSLPVVSPISLDRIGGELLEVGDELKESGRLLREMLGSDATRGNWKSLLANFSALSADLREISAAGKRDLPSGFQKASQAAARFETRIDEIAASLEELISLLRDIAGENRDSIRTGISRVDALTERAEEALRRLDDNLIRLDSGQGTLGRLIHSPDLYQNAETTLGDIRRAVDPLSALRIDVGLRFEYLTSPEKSRGALSLTLRPRSGRFVLGEILRDPNEDRFVYSLQGGIRSGAFAPRAGILQSRFGFGLDGYFWNDRLKISFEGFDFNRAPRPRLRILSRLQAYGPLHLLFGLDDLAWEKGREFFLGLGWGR